MKDADSIISLWNSVTDFAGDIGVKVSHAHVMKTRNSIPARRWPRVVEEARKRGFPITFDVLEKAHTNVAPRARAREEGAA